MKKIISALTIICLILTLVAPAAFAADAELTANAAYDSVSGKLAVSGVSPSGQGESVTMIMLDPHNQTINIGQIITGQGGSYSFEGVKLIENGKYSITVTDAKSKKNKNIVYTLESKAPEVPGTVVVAPTPAQDISTQIDNAIKGMEAKTTEQVVTDAAGLIKEAAKLTGDKKAAAEEKVSAMVEKVLEKAAKLEAKDIEKKEESGVLNVQVKTDALKAKVADVLSSIEKLSKELKDAKLENIALAKEVKIEVAESAKQEIKVALSAESLKELSGNGLNLVIKTNDVSFSIPPKAVELDQSAEKYSQVQITSKRIKDEEAGKLKEAAVKVAEQGTTVNTVSGVYDFKAEAVTDSTTKIIEGFKDKVKVSIPYDNADGKVNAEKLGVYRYNPETLKWDYVGGKVDKAAGRIEFATGHFSIYSAMEYNKTFDDINNHWAKNEVELMASKHIVKGAQGNEFLPEIGITRAEFTAMMVRTMGLEEKKYKAGFKDVAEVEWYAGYIQTGYEAGIINGEGDTFRPEDKITREEISAIVIRAYKQSSGQSVPGSIEEFKDRQEISQWAVETVKEAVGIGILKGKDGGMLVPKANATRAEAAVMIKRLLDKM